MLTTGSTREIAEAQTTLKVHYANVDGMCQGCEDLAHFCWSPCPHVRHATEVIARNAPLHLSTAMIILDDTPCSPEGYSSGALPGTEGEPSKPSTTDVRHLAKRGIRRCRNGPTTAALDPAIHRARVTR